jgi:hypothetical protein
MYSAFSRCLFIRIRITPIQVWEETEKGFKISTLEAEEKHSEAWSVILIKLGIPVFIRIHLIFIVGL